MTSHTIDFYGLNAMLNILDADGKIQFDADKEAAKQYFLQHVNQNTVFFHSLEEKIEYLVREGYYKPEVVDAYNFSFIKKLFKKAYAKKFRFPTFLGAYKYYTSYTMKTLDNTRYLERYEDRICMVALTLARGDETLAVHIMEEIISGRFQPATPTFLNAGKIRAGELVSCFLIRTEDNMESIARTINGALQLSKRGGGVAINLTNLREVGAPIKEIEDMSSGVVPVMKLLEDSFSYANQLGARQGAGAVYLSAHHPDIMRFLDTKRENADEKIRIKTLSLGLVVPDITFKLAQANEPMYLFSPYDVERIYGVPFSDISITEKYAEMVDNPEIKKTKISAREFFKTVAEIQFESGYPYLMFEDNVNKQNPGGGRVSMSNLCTEILQESSPSVYNEDLTYAEVGRDISCNLGSQNIALALGAGENFGLAVETAIRALSSVSLLSKIDSVPSIREGNDKTHAIGLGQMNLHGFFGKERIHYDSPEAVDFTNLYFTTVAYHAIRASMLIAKETGEKFEGFEKSKYANGEYFVDYITSTEYNTPKTDKVAKIFAKYKVSIPTSAEWEQLSRDVQEFGIFNKYLQAIPPTGSISYINNSTSSIHPIVSKIEIRKEGKIGRVYYPAPFMTNDNLEFYKDAYEIGPEALINVYAAATRHVDQGLSCTLFFPASATTRDLNRAQIYAWKKNIKTLYYIRLRQEVLTGTEVEGCVSCAL